MESSSKRIVIATRESPLALWQAHHVKNAIESFRADVEVGILGMTTRGDRILDRSLSKVGGKGLFVKELERALLDGEADLAVHSMKDVPMRLEDPFLLVATTARADPSDALVSPRYGSVEELPPGARVGTGSLRREALLRLFRPDLEVSPLRGNVQTRLRKLDEGEYDAILLASAGLDRLGLAERIRKRLDPRVYLPAPGQAALGIEILKERTDLAELLSALNDPVAEREVMAERRFSAIFGGSCQLPLGAFCQIDVDRRIVRMRAMMADPETWETRAVGTEEPLCPPEELAMRLADRIKGEEGSDPFKTLVGDESSR